MTLTSAFSDPLVSSARFLQQALHDTAVNLQRIYFNEWALYRVRVQCCFTSTDTVRTLRDGETRTATSASPQSSEPLLSYRKNIFTDVNTGACVKETNPVRACSCIKYLHVGPIRFDRLLSIYKLVSLIIILNRTRPPR